MDVHARKTIDSNFIDDGIKSHVFLGEFDPI